MWTWHRTNTEQFKWEKDNDVVWYGYCIFLVCMDSYSTSASSWKLRIWFIITGFMHLFRAVLHSSCTPPETINVTAHWLQRTVCSLSVWVLHSFHPPLQGGKKQQHTPTWGLKLTLWKSSIIPPCLDLNHKLPSYDLHEKSRPGMKWRWPAPARPAGLMKAPPPLMFWQGLMSTSLSVFSWSHAFAGFVYVAVYF